MCILLTREVEDLRPLFADIDPDVGSTHSKVGPALVKDQRLHLKTQNTQNEAQQKALAYIISPSRQKNILSPSKQSLSHISDMKSIFYGSEEHQPRRLQNGRVC